MNPNNTMKDEIKIANEYIQAGIDLLPQYIEEEYPKGNPERGAATTHIALFLKWLQKGVTIDKPHEPQQQ